MYKFVIAAIFSISSSLSLANILVFGFELGKPLIAPECAFRMVGNLKLYESLSIDQCVEDAKIKTHEPTESALVRLGKDSSPLFMKGLFRAYLKDGVFVGASFSTFGIHTQNSTFDALKEKYGKPTKLTKIKMQNSAGATFDVIFAEWKNKTVHVSFKGVDEQIDLGSVDISTPELLNLRQIKDLELKAQKTPL